MRSVVGWTGVLAALLCTTACAKGVDNGLDDVDGGTKPAGEGGAEGGPVGCGTCPTGATCVQGACQCSTGFKLCGAKCVDTQNDAKNCGGCGNACGADAGGTWSCVQGQCMSGCAAPRQVCSGTCVDPRVDLSNCGMCGTACGGGQACCSSACADTTTDSNNCGGCGKACTGATPDCCGACVNKQTDTNNCGQCGNQCGGGLQCKNGACCTQPQQGSCSHSLCAQGGSLSLTCDGLQLCVVKVCQQNPLCCALGWSASCVAAVAAECAPLSCSCM